MSKQLAVLIENRPGALADLTALLAETGVNVDAIMIEGSLDFGTARIHAPNARKIEKVLREHGYQVASGDVLVMRLTNEAGALAKVCKTLAREKINIECMFGTTNGADEAEFVFKVDDPERARRALGLAS
ncbi:MAG TPA: ACT domain-containing protein [Candidatus Thermoplasmatota archaeon]|nr:ACT domain-containing protein [Candidatus Thermoplasmatota archaeon]